MTRPQRHRKDDRVLHGILSADEIRCDLATAPFDAAARAMDLKWGQDRLPELVSPATADRWGLAMANLNAALASADPALVVARVNACVRGFAAMDAEAVTLGGKPISPDAWEFDLEGTACAILKDDAAWPAYHALRPGVRIYTLREVVNALASYGQTVAAVKDAFPGAQVVEVRKRTKLEIDLDDDLPF